MAAGTPNPVKRLQDFGQSVWLDYLRRSLIDEGGIERLIDEDGLRGLTSNPAIFEKAIAGSTDYTSALKTFEGELDRDANEIYEHLAIEDIQRAADVFRPVYDATNRGDGYVSLEVSPYLARDTTGTIEEARRLWSTVHRPNLMVKVPATPEGIPAIQQLISEGININVTLLFGLEMYQRVVEAYLAGLTQRAATGGSVDHIASVASFFVSRVDTAADTQIADRLAKGPSPRERAILQGLLGKVAVANAKLSYELYKDLFAGADWEALSEKGAHTQRLLWASTGTKNPAYSDVLYIEELVGADTVTTVPPATLDAFRDHGKLRPSLEEDVEEARDAIQSLEEVGISLREITDGLMNDGVKLFADSFDQLLGAVEERRREILGRCVDHQTAKLPEDLQARVKTTLEDWRREGNIRRLWRHDASLWTSSDEASWLGWLAITDDQQERESRFIRLSAEVKAAGFSHAVLLGMGGSSLCPEVMATTFGSAEGHPTLRVLDSTDPDQVRAVEQSIDLPNTLFIVSSKSGTTLEPNILKDYFFERVGQALGREKAGTHFIAITDPGSKLQETAERDGFRAIYYGLSSIGGRYSALSDFGMVPAAVIGVDVPRFLESADIMVNSCAPSVPPEDNPGVTLGTILGVAGSQGRDKVTIVASPGIADVGAWIEQLIAESTGKQGKGLIPIDREALAAPALYGQDRVFAYLRLESDADPAQDQAVDALEQAGHPVARISIMDHYELGQEFFRWEMATAVAGSILGINPFDQPDVEESKDVTRRLATAYEESGHLPTESPFFQEGEIALFADDRNAQALTEAVGSQPSVDALIKAHLNRLSKGDYFALLAYIERNDANQERLQKIRHAVRDSKRNATALGFGPRFLHSTGQAYKGGPNAGVFLQVTCDHASDLAVPGKSYTFGVVEAAQARGDFEVLANRGRRALRVHLRGDLDRGLQRLADAINGALA